MKTNAMNDEFLHQLRVKPSQDFAARLKATLDRQVCHPAPRHSSLLRVLVATALIGGTAFAVTALSVRSITVTLRSLLGMPDSVGTPSLTYLPADPGRGADVFHAVDGDAAASAQGRDSRAQAVGSPISEPNPSANELSASGTSFAYPLYTSWATTYRQQTGVSLNYVSNDFGQSWHIFQLNNYKVTFIATDVPLGSAQLKELDLVQFPLVVGGVVLIANLKGANGADLTLDGPTLAGIYMGTIRTWNDARIQKLNPGINLPTCNIVPISRSRSSGMFLEYLSKSDANFNSRLGVGAGLPVQGDADVWSATAQRPCTIGYVDYRYATRNNLAQVRLLNKAGNVVTASPETLSAAASNTDWTHSPGDDVSLIDQPGAQSWPLTGASFIVMHRQSQDIAATAEALKFFDWAYESGGKIATDLDYVALPQSAIEQVHKTWQAQISGAPDLNTHEPQ
jgi:phosphate transport system substrate-binding protein